MMIMSSGSMSLASAARAVQGPTVGSDLSDPSRPSHPDLVRDGASDYAAALSLSDIESFRLSLASYVAGPVNLNLNHDQRGPGAGPSPSDVESRVNPTRPAPGPAVMGIGPAQA